MSPFPAEPLNTASSGSVSGKWSAPVQPIESRGECWKCGYDGVGAHQCEPVQPTPEPDTGGEVCACPPPECHAVTGCPGRVHLPGPPSVAAVAADSSDQTALRKVVELAIARSPETPDGFLGEDITTAVLASEWLADRLAEAVKAERERIAAADLVALLTAQREWSSETFGPGSRLVGVVDHIRKELVEIEESHGDLTEWIDVVILALDGAWRTGASPEHIVNCLNQKYAKNRARSWPDWRTADPNKAIEHVPDVSDYLDQGCKVCGRDNRNGTHDALESVGHLRHHWQPALARTAPLQDAEEVGE